MHHERAGHRTRATNLAATAEKVVLATSQDGARKRKEATMKCYPRPRPETTSEEFLALLILLGPFAFVLRWIWRRLVSSVARWPSA